MPRPLVWSLFALCVLIWSSTWVAIKFGLEATPPLLGAGLRFLLAGVLLLAVACAMRRSLRTDARLAVLLGALPFALAYGLIYWGELHIPSGLAAVLFGVMPLYSAVMATAWLAGERGHPRLFVGIAVAIGGLAIAYGESVALGDDELAYAGALACLVAPLASAAGNTAIKLCGAALDAVVLNGWAMLAGGLLLLAASASTEAWDEAIWNGQALAAIGYLAVIGSAVPFVVLTLLLRELPAVTLSYIALLLPFGALAFGAALYDERLTLPALAGAGLVAAGLAVAQQPAGRRRRARRPPAARPSGPR